MIHDHLDGQNVVHFRPGPPSKLRWWKAGRAATKAQVEEALAYGIGLIRERATRDADGSTGELDKRLAALDALLPSA